MYSNRFFLIDESGQLFLTFHENLNLDVLFNNFALLFKL